jgi:hypothetical protein
MKTEKHTVYQGLAVYTDIWSRIDVNT